jgi:opacity protein-like surface antigen
MMKVLTLAAAALVLLAASQLVANVGATGQSSINRRVATLEKKLVLMQKKLKTTQAQVTTLRNDWTCLKGRGLTEWGKRGTTSGYQYTDNAGVNWALLPALDFTYGNNQSDVWMVVTDEGCIPGAST